MTKIRKMALVLSALLFLLTNCKETKSTESAQEPTKVPTSLKSSFAKSFYLGAAINESQIMETDAKGIAVINREFNTLTPENNMKWMYLQPTPNSFDFTFADKYVALGEKMDMFVVGHTLVWHSQLPNFMHSVKDSAAMATHIKNHIHTVMGRYKGRIHAWDVVNEALNEDGSLRQSLFQQVLGDDYIEYAFQLASQADPEAKLIYNDYNLWKPEKRAGVVRLVKRLQEKGIQVDGVGMQAHWSLEGPSLEDIENSIIAYSELGVKVQFTELDVTALPNPWEVEGAEVSQNYEEYEGDLSMDPYRTGLPDSVQTKLANRYQEIFELFLKHQDKIDRVTFWGVNDGGSWLNGWPIKGRTNHPLLFDRNFAPKKAYTQVLALKKKDKLSFHQTTKK